MSYDIVWIFLHLHKTGGTTFSGHLRKFFEWDKEHIDIGPGGRHFRWKHHKKPFEKRPLKERNKAKIITGHFTYYGIHTLMPDKEPRYITFLRDPAKRIVSSYNHFEYTRFKNKNPKSFISWYKSITKNPTVNFYFFKSNKLRYKIQDKVYGPANFFIERRLNEKTAGLLRKMEGLPSKTKFELAKNVLDNCWYVGITESLDKDLEILCDVLGINKNWKNYRVAGDNSSSFKKYEPDTEEKIYKIYNLDDKIETIIKKKDKLDYLLYNYALKLNKEHRRKFISI